MTARTRLQRGVRLGTALSIIAWAAAIAMEPEPARAALFLREVTGCLAVGLLITSAGGAADRAFRIARTERRRSVSNFGSLWARVMAPAVRDAAIAVALALPVLVAAWECGASTRDLSASAVAVIAATLSGIIVGSLAGIVRLPPPAGALLAASLGALILWPRALGWMEDLSFRFPAPETPTRILVLFAAGAILSTHLLAARRGRRDAFR